MRKLKKVFLLFAFAAAVTLPSHASESTNKLNASVADQTCSQAFEGERVGKNNGTVCRQDVALNMLAIGLGESINSNPAILDVFNYFNIYVPELSPRAMIGSVPFDAASKAMVSLGTILTIVFFGIRGWKSGLRAMSSQELMKAAQDKEIWKAGGALSVVAILMFPLGDVIVGQVVVVGAFLGSLIASVYILSSVIDVFGFSAKTSDAVSSTESFEGLGQSFASNVVNAAYASQSNAMVFNSANVKAEDAKILIEKSSSSASVSWMEWITSLFSDYTEKDPTVEEWVDGMFNSSSVIVKYNGMHSRRLASIVAGPSNGKSADETTFESIHDYGDIFTGTSVFGSEVRGSTTVDLSIYKLVSGSEALKKLKGKYPKGGSLSVEDKSRIVFDIGSEFANEIPKLLDSLKADGIEAQPRDLIVAFQNLALDLIHTRSRGQWSFNPLDVNSIPLRGGIYEEIVLSAYQSADHLRAYQCTKNLPEFADEFLAVHQLKEAKDSEEIKGVLTSPTIVGQCLKIEGGSVVARLSPELYSLIEEAIVDLPNTENSSLKDQLIKINQVSQKNGFAAKHLKDAQSSMGEIADYYSMVSSIGRFAEVKGLSLRNNDREDGFLAKLRLQGPLATPSYMQSLSEIQSRFVVAMAGGAPEFSFTTNYDSETGMLKHLRDDYVENEDLLIKVERYKSFQGDTSSALVSDSVELRSISSEADVAIEAETGMDDIINYVVDMVLPSQDTLVVGFGMGDENDTLAGAFKKCSSTMNCVDFEQHPLVTISLFGKELFLIGIQIKAVDFVVQLINDNVQSALSGGFDGDLKKSKSGLGSKIATKLVGFLGDTGYGSAIKFLIASLAFFMSIMSVVASGFILAGAFLGYILPMMPLITQFLMSLGWIAETLLLFAFVPVLLPLVILLKNDGSGVLSLGAITKMYMSILLRGPLILIAYLLFFAMSYAAIYAINSIIFNVVALDSYNALQSGGVMGAYTLVMSKIVMILLAMLLYFVAIKTLTDYMMQSPDFAMRAMGVEGLRASVQSGFEQYLQARTISGYVDKAATSAFSKVRDKTVKRARQEGAKKAQADLASKLQEKGHDLKELLK
ncbi:TPA: hypothetical protein I7730_01345 [Vibrio vulnificus]|uniref:Uncharacterized protein n=1 Tax=Vibrio vulnificus TaxID=672 RepID=A0A8H9MY85_VIBVL|nr:hypothetical protein [Vibrio vulnificus]HAS8538441.1 hypothetical protein [Vibrio vulnificus]